MFIDTSDRNSRGIVVDRYNVSGGINRSRTNMNPNKNTAIVDGGLLSELGIWPPTT